MFSTSGYSGLGLDASKATAAEKGWMPKEVWGASAECAARGLVPQYDIKRKSFSCMARGDTQAGQAMCRAAGKLPVWNNDTKQWDCVESKYYTAALAKQDTGAGEWWASQPTGTKAGIVIGGLAVLGVVGFFVYDTFFSAPPMKAKANRRRVRKNGSRYGRKKPRTIDIYVRGRYVGSTTWPQSLADVRSSYLAEHRFSDTGLTARDIECVYADETTKAKANRRRRARRNGTKRLPAGYRMKTALAPGWVVAQDRQGMYVVLNLNSHTKQWDELEWADTFDKARSLGLHRVQRSGTPWRYGGAAVKHRSNRRRGRRHGRS